MGEEAGEVPGVGPCGLTENFISDPKSDAQL